ncbi:hypothetical protein [Rhodoblastus sp.]|uniref:hypothetical protein n=1 Tax=Rhodoblastus sp. TaxID=1962975 RepID=UPI003F9B5A39
MSKGPGRIQQAILKLIETTPDGAWELDELAGLIHGVEAPAKAQIDAVARALAGVTLPGTWGVYLEDKEAGTGAAKGETAREILAEHARAGVGKPASVRAAVALSQLDRPKPTRGPVSVETKAGDVHVSEHKSLRPLCESFERLAETHWCDPSASWDYDPAKAELFGRLIRDLLGAPTDAEFEAKWKGWDRWTGWKSGD